MDEFSKEVVLVNTNYPREILQTLSQYRANRQHTDVTLTVGGTIFHCHSAVLAASSAYFQTLLSSGTSELQHVIDSGNISSKAFQVILDYIYSGELDSESVDPEIMDQVLTLSGQWEINGLKKLCEEYFMNIKFQNGCMAVMGNKDQHEVDFQPEDEKKEKVDVEGTSLEPKKEPTTVFEDSNSDVETDSSYFGTWQQESNTSKPTISGLGGNADNMAVKAHQRDDMLLAIAKTMREEKPSLPNMTAVNTGNDIVSNRIVSSADNSSLVLTDSVSNDPLVPKQQTGYVVSSTIEKMVFNTVNPTRSTNDLTSDKKAGKRLLKPFKCDTCSKAFSRKSKLKQHVGVHSTERPYECSVCSKSFKHSGHLSKHEKSHTKETKRIPCQMCPKTFRSDASLTRHVQNHTREKPFGCQYCDKRFSQRSDCTTHELVHNRPRNEFKEDATTSEPFPCQICEKVFGSNSDLARHNRIQHELRIHKQKKPNECKFCSETFTELQDLHRHESTHSKARPYVCIVCPEAFSFYIELLNHYKQHADVMPFVCVICKAAFSHPKDLQEHERSVHKDEKYPCLLCSKICDSRRGLGVHEKLFHPVTKPYACKFCSDTFKEKNKLDKHESSHTGEKPFICDLCPEVFSEDCNLSKHKRNIHFKCQYCSDEFTDMVSLLEHEKSKHSGDKPYCCPKCLKTFSQKSSRDTHIVTSHPDGPMKDEIHTCLVCLKSFRTKYRLAEHKTVHSSERPYICSFCAKGFKTRKN